MFTVNSFEDISDIVLVLPLFPCLCNYNKIYNLQYNLQDILMTMVNIIVVITGSSRKTEKHITLIENMFAWNKTDFLRFPLISSRGVLRTLSNI